jgi:hypothetical protein
MSVRSYQSTRRHIPVTTVSSFPSPFGAVKVVKILPSNLELTKNPNLRFFWDVTLYTKQGSVYHLHSRYLGRLIRRPENGGDMFLRNVGWLSTDYTALYPRRQ